MARIVRIRFQNFTGGTAHFNASPHFPEVFRHLIIVYKNIPGGIKKVGEG